MNAIPFLTTEQMRAVDLIMIEEYGIELIQMMENAGRNLAHLARTRFLDGDPVGKRVAVLAGRGGNGGGALVAARRLHNWGALVHVALAQPAAAFKGIPGRQLKILQNMQVAISSIDVNEVDTRYGAYLLVLDGVIGYSLRGAPRDGAAQLIRWANEQGAPVLALDAPSGLDATTGAAHDPTIRAAATMTLALPKVGLRAPRAEDFVGALYLADIGAPPELYARLAAGLAPGPLFAADEIIRL